MKLKLGTFAGIGVYIHWTFWLLPAWILFSAGGGLGGALFAVLFVFAVFGCVVLHEFGHALMARRFNVGTRDITLYPIGGVARLERMPTRPAHELAIAVAGPAVNVVIAAVLFAVLVVAGIGTQGLFFNLASGSFLVNLFFVNVALVVFNMLPAFPMDGGRVLRAFLAMRMSYLRATEIAVRVGQVVALALGLLGLISGGMLIFIAIFVFLAAQAELAMARLKERSEASRVIDAQSWPHQPTQPSPPADPEIVWLQPHPDSDSNDYRTLRVRL